MDYLLFLVGLVMMYRGNLSWLYVIIILLASTYLQLPLRGDMRMMVGPEHNVADVGLLLYLLYFFKEVSKNGVCTTHPVQKATTFFLLFVIMNGLIDALMGGSWGDVIRYWKHWPYLTIVYLRSVITRQEVKKCMEILFWMTFAVSIVLILQSILGVMWIGWGSDYVSNGVRIVRGAKPPSFAVICAVLAFVNVFGYSRKIQILTTAIIGLPILLCIKMSYFTTILIIMVVYYFFNGKLHFTKVFKYGIVGLVGFVTLFAVHPAFRQRMEDTLQQSSVLSSSSTRKEGNFSYRIEHFKERLDYVVSDPVRFVRGMGYVQERNFHQNLFKLGQTNNWGRRAQLDTGDIAWSLLIIRLGVLGIFVYLLFYAKCLRELYKRKSDSDFEMVYFAYAFASIVFMSFGNTLVASGDFFIIPLLICMSHEDSALYLGV